MKKIIGWLHLWLGIGSGLVVLVVALTGSLLVFEDELEHLFQPSLYYVQVPAQAEKIPVAILAADVKNRYPDYRLNSIITEPEANRTVIFTVLKGKNAKNGKVIAMAVNPYTGQIIKAVNEKDRFFSVVLRLHRYLCIGETGKIITGISCSIFTILIITGLILWWPKRNNRKQRFRIKWNASFKRLNWDLHAVSGFYINIVLLSISLTGLVWSYKWVNNLLFYAFDGSLKNVKMKPPKSEPVKDNSIAYLDKILTTTNEKLTYPGTVTIRFGENDSIAVAVAKLNTTASIGNVSDFLYFQAGTGKLVQERPYAKESAGTKARRLVYPIHTGSLYGWPTKILALISALVGASLPITGFMIWLGRKKKKEPVSLKKHANTRVQYQ
ncbi:PepSY domain-containing protein [Chitinophaga sp. CF118]|uniref:PepSY-associated TM helix domain-containing protein n=1 Tax=Chitinophaga sp. CF118 TaxID=1884367 RepID=UPI000B7D2911|nr:PepSY-associated TM helix domain-containing protein [Chitinophaga sp. CF118]